VPVDHQLTVRRGDGARDRLQVRTHVGLGERERGDDVKRRHRRQPALADRVAAALGEGEAADALHREERVEMPAHAGQRLADHRHRERVDPRTPAAVLAPHSDLRQPAIAQRLPHDRIDTVRLIGHRRAPGHRRRERARLGPQLPVLRRELKQAAVVSDTHQVSLRQAIPCTIHAYHNNDLG